MDFSFTEKSTFDNQFELNSGGSYTDTKLPDQNFLLHTIRIRILHKNSVKLFLSKNK